LLGLGDGLGVECGDFGGSLGLLGCALGFGGEEGAVAGGVGEAFGYGGGDARGAGVGGYGFGFGGWLGMEPVAAVAVGGQTLGDLEAERFVRCWSQCRGRGMGMAGCVETGRVERCCIQQCGAHCAQTQTRFREIV